MYTNKSIIGRTILRANIATEAKTIVFKLKQWNQHDNEINNVKIHTYRHTHTRRNFFSLFFIAQIKVKCIQ